MWQDARGQLQGPQTSVREDGELGSAGRERWEGADKQKDRAGQRGSESFLARSTGCSRPLRRCTLCCPLQEAFPDHHPGTKLGVTEWNTALLRPLDSSASQWRRSWSSLLTCSVSPGDTPPFSYRDIRVFPKVFEKADPIMLEIKTGEFFFSELCHRTGFSVTNWSAPLKRTITQS